MRPRDVIDYKRTIVGGLQQAVEANPPELRDQVRRVGEQMPSWSNYLVTGEMTRVVAAAARSLPTSQPEDYDGLVPSPTGFTLYDKPVGTMVEEGTEQYIHGLVWCGEHVWIPSTTAGGIAFSVLFSEGEDDRRYWLNKPMRWPGKWDDAGRHTLVHLAFATWHLMTEKISVSSPGDVDRACRRQASRENMPSDVLVYKLRSAARYTERETGVGSEWGGYSHRFIVDAHWRNHYYPSDGTHRPLLILPYVKGPESAPLVVKDKVHVLAR